MYDNVAAILVGLGIISDIFLIIFSICPIWICIPFSEFHSPQSLPQQVFQEGAEAEKRARKRGILGD